jgi:exodeoxyribonuclease V beta subunit
MVARDVFDPCGPLPSGTTVLEASAGTGKTHTIASLATRYVAEGIARIDELMLVTFGRAATVELRERVRERFVATAAALTDPAGARASADPVVALLATGSAEEVETRRVRLANAVADFDAATIATTHGFCLQMLAGLGVAADVDPDLTFTETTADVTAEVVGDLYVRAYGRPDSAAPPFDLATATKLGNQAVGDRQARLEPLDAVPDSVADVRRRLGDATRRQVESRKRRRRLMDYDDLLVHLRDALVDPATGRAARARIRNRYTVVMVDEFQDTDPVQWQILDSAFHGHRTLVLIGDPKQAIYAFRGADVVTYLLATGSAGAAATLGTNWRSDEPLLDAFEHVMGGVALGDQRIVVHPVAAAHQGRRLVGAAAPMRLRVVERDAVTPGNDAPLRVDPARAYVARDAAADIVALLGSEARLEGPEGARALRPNDVAVLVQTNKEAGLVHDALQAARVPVVLTGTSSVFLSDAAGDWLTLLSALEQPQRSGLARAAALTSFVGWTPDRLDLEDPDGDVAFDELTALLHEWAELLARRGVAALLEAAGRQMVPRILGREHGERLLTDLRHIGQVLHTAATEGKFGVASMVEWLQHRMAEAAADQTEERSRRLESDADAVQVITVHRSKGLEFPVVYAPFLWDRWVPRTPDPLTLHDADGNRVLDVGGPTGEGYDDRRTVHLREDAGESLRLAYVALTRASAQVVAHWAPTSNTRSGPLHRLLFAERTTDGELPESVTVGSDEFVRRRLDELAARSGGSIVVESAYPDDGEWRFPANGRADLRVRRFDRVLDSAWTRTSYSGLTAGLHDTVGAGATSEAEDPGTVDEPEAPRRAAPAEPVGPTSTPASFVSPMAGLPTGAAFGTFVHAVLEQTDFAAGDLRTELTTAAERTGFLPSTGVPPAELAEALTPALLTPLRGPAGERALADVTTTDRLDELDFELPLAGGDRPVQAARVGAIAELLRNHLPADDPLRGYADDLDVPELAGRSLRGFLTGSIDAVLRLREPAGDSPPRYVVVDYKTNWLGGDRLTAADYAPEAMTTAMQEAHYPLQALLYSVALHRYLRWRQPGYDPAVHLGGIQYLFLRGMCGPDTPVVGRMTCGVFTWTPPAALVVDVSRLLAGRVS